MCGDGLKKKICLDLVKKFLGDGNQFKEIEIDVNQIKADPPIVKIHGKPNFTFYDFISSDKRKKKKFFLLFRFEKFYLSTVPELSGGEHKTLHNTSKKLELRSSPEYGNFVVANDEIKTGETIVVEKPIAACLLPKYFGSHCLHCLRR